MVSSHFYVHGELAVVVARDLRMGRPRVLIPALPRDPGD